MFSSFTLLDGIILVAYLIVVLSFGFYYSRRQAKNPSDYFLAGRTMGWVTVGMSIFATNISSEHFIGLAGSGAARGLAVGQFEIMAIFILLALGWFIAPVYMKSGVTSMPEFLEKRFDKRSRKFFATLSIILYIFTKISVTLFAGGILFYKIFGINIYASAIIIVLITGIYSVLGGATAVMKNHIFQTVMLILGAVMLTAFGLHEAGGLRGLQQKLPADYFSMFKPMSDPDFPWTGIIFGAPIIAFWYWCTDQYIVQRVLSSKSIDDARRGSLLAAFFKITPIFILVLPGLIAVALFPEIQGDDAYPTLLASNILPMGVKGFVLAGLLSAIMSSLASVFNVTSALFTNDFYKPRHPEASDRKLVLVARLSTMVTIVAAILCVPLVRVINSQVYLYLQNIQSLVAPPVTVVFLAGILSKKVTARAAIWTLVIGEVIGMAKLVLDMMISMNMVHNTLLLNVAAISFLHFTILLFIVCAFVIVLLSYIPEETGANGMDKVSYFFSDSIKDVSYDSAEAAGALTGGNRINLMFSLAIIAVVFVFSLWGIFF
ncbi:MAG TPA: sodium:solute symporter [Ignavibacteriales bacterium]|nr:sodium:solute symporter [Ignavibacteriales bacterium]